MPELTPVLPSLSSIAEKIFQEIQATNRVTDDQLASLDLLFGGHFDKATQIVDQGGVFAFVGRESQRKVYQVQGNKSKDNYTVFPRHYCSCHSFLFEVATKSEATYCKHQLAVLLAESLNLSRTHTVEDLTLADLLQGHS